MARNSQLDDPDDDGRAAPFRVLLSSPSDPSEGEPVDSSAEETFSLEDIEAAYLRALETAEVADAIVAAAPLEGTNDDCAVEDEPAEDNSAEGNIARASDDGEKEPQPGRNVSTVSSPAKPVVTPQQVVEALLFVGGMPLPARRIAELLGASATPESVMELIDQLNHRYLSESRPYEIQLLEGGYRLVLKEEFESVRRRVYGQGPREVKLAQEALEVLAFVAYLQPVTRGQLEETGREQIGTILRQLLRRQLISLDRKDAGTERYRTTSRFLQLFGLRSLQDLPQSIDFNFK